ncbi:hypothetical protein HAX54_001247, partial [Datura stramonium]|nr:hypothetical protein [Datura stramonium]
EELVENSSPLELLFHQVLSQGQIVHSVDRPTWSKLTFYLELLIHQFLIDIDEPTTSY